MFLQPDLIRSRITIQIRLLLSHLIKAASKQRFGPGHPTVQITAGLPQIVAVIVHSIVCVPLERRAAAVQRDDRHKEQIPVHLRLGMRVESLKPLTLRSRSLLPPDIFLVQRTVPPRGIQIIHQLSQAGLTIGNERIVRCCNITDLQSIRNESRFRIGSLFFPKLADCLPTFVSFLSLAVLSLYRKLNTW